MEFEWDEAKAVATIVNHNVTFEEATSVFFDFLADTNRDFVYSLDEERFLTMGKSNEDRLLVISHTDRDGVIRLISVRLATREERRGYENG